MLKEWATRLRFLIFRRTRRELDEELEFHLDQQTQANIAAGMSPREARRQALIAFGGHQHTREECSAQRPDQFIETLFQDIRYALRGFRRDRTFSIALVLTLMLGIGATTAVFSVVDRILFRSLPYVHADRLVSVGLVAPIEPQEFMLGGSYYDWRDNQTPFEAFTSETGVSPCDLTMDGPARLNCTRVEATFLPTLGISPLLGRNFTAEEDRPNGRRVALISYRLWQRRFNSDAGTLNKLVSFDGAPTRIIGVLPKEFEMPTLEAADVILPQALDEAEQRKADPGRVMFAFARLKPGVTIEQAKAALKPVFDYSLRLAPGPFRKEVHLQVRSLRDRQVHDVLLVAWILLGVVLAVLLIACANVSSLLLARGAARERELAVRSALGASRARLVRQALTESIVLALAGAIAGCAFAVLLLRLFIAAAPQGMPFLNKAQIDARIILFTLGLSFVCGILFGLVPAFYKPRAEALAGRALTIGSRAFLRQSLVVVQIAASMVLLAAGALLFRSFWNLENQKLGMHTESVATARISLGRNSYPDAQRQMAFFLQLERQLRYGPGIAMMAQSDSLPPGGDHSDQIYASLIIPGKPRAINGTGGRVASRRVTSDYFHLLGIPLLQGAGFSEEQRTSGDRFVVLSKTLASRLFPDQDPVGQHLQLGAGVSGDPIYTVAGVVADVKNAGLAGEDEPEYYRLRRNVPEDWNRNSVLLLKTNLPANDMKNWIRAQVASLDPTVPVDIELLSERVSELAEQPRFQTILVGFFAATGLVLAIIGLYGVIAFLVAQRTQEIGVRIALGASKASILRLVLGKSLRLIGLGTALGLLSSLAAARILSTLLFNISPHDPVTLLTASVILAGVALLATLIPATSAARVDPLVALRYE